MAVYDFDKKDEPDLRSEKECFPDIDVGIQVSGDRVLVNYAEKRPPVRVELFW